MNNQFIIDNLLHQNEGERLEFKLHYNEAVIARQVVGMLNAKGGDIILGISDKKEILGVFPKLDINAIRLRLMSAIKPTAPIHVTEIAYDGKQVVLISAWEGSQKPYMYEGKIYQRLMDATYDKAASTQEISRMISERSLAESNWERQPVLDVEIEDLDIEELHTTKQAYQQQLGIKDLSDEEFLMRCGLIQNGDLTKACVVLYAKNPLKYIPQISVRLSVYASDDLADLVDTKLFEGNLFKNIDALLQYFDVTYAKRLQINGPVREEIWNYPRIAVREGIMNALVHKDYSRPSAITNIRIFPSSLEIQNTGALPTSISFDQMENDSCSILRNPDIAHQCYYRGLIEMMGTGIARIKQDCKNNNFMSPVFSDENGIIKVKFPGVEHKTIAQKKNIDFRKIVNEVFYASALDVRDKMTTLLEAIYSHPGMRVSALQELISVPEKTLERYIKTLKEANFIEYRGAKKTGGYFISGSHSKDDEGINEGINRGINEGINEL